MYNLKRGPETDFMKNNDQFGTQKKRAKVNSQQVRSSLTGTRPGPKMLYKTSVKVARLKPKMARAETAVEDRVT